MRQCCRISGDLATFSGVSGRKVVVDGSGGRGVGASERMTNNFSVAPSTGGITRERGVGSADTVRRKQHIQQ